MLAMDWSRVASNSSSLCWTESPSVRRGRSSPELGGCDALGSVDTMYRPALNCEPGVGDQGGDGVPQLPVWFGTDQELGLDREVRWGAKLALVEDGDEPEAGDAAFDDLIAGLFVDVAADRPDRGVHPQSGRALDPARTPVDRGDPLQC